MVDKDAKHSGGAIRIQAAHWLCTDGWRINLDMDHIGGRSTCEAGDDVKIGVTVTDENHST